MRILDLEANVMMWIVGDDSDPEDEPGYVVGYPDGSWLHCTDCSDGDCLHVQTVRDSLAIALPVAN